MIRAGRLHRVGRNPAGAGETVAVQGQGARSAQVGAGLHCRRRLELRPLVDQIDAALITVLHEFTLDVGTRRAETLLGRRQRHVAQMDLDRRHALDGAHGARRMLDPRLRRHNLTQRRLGRNILLAHHRGTGDKEGQKKRKNGFFLISSLIPLLEKQSQVFTCFAKRA